MSNAGLNVVTPLLAALLAVPGFAYDYPLSPEAIREAYFLGTRQGGLGAAFLGQYVRSIPELKQGTCTSEARIGTPFLQVADYASKAVNYSAQDAVKHFYDKPAVFRTYLNICYAVKAPPPNSITIRVLQDRKVLVPYRTSGRPMSSLRTRAPTSPATERKFTLSSSLASSIPQPLPSRSTRRTASTPKQRLIYKLFGRDLTFN
jgi:hypothetical protein